MLNTELLVSVYEEDEANAEVMAMILEDSGYKVRIVKDPKQISMEPQIVFFDLGSNLEAGLREMRLRQLDYDPKTHIFIPTTTSPSHEALTDLKNILPKPFDINMPPQLVQELHPLRRGVTKPSETYTRRKTENQQ